MIYRYDPSGRENESASYFELPVSRTCVQNMIRNGEHSGDVFDSPVSKLIRKFLRKRKDRHIAELEAERGKLRDALSESLALIENMVGDLDMEFLSYYSEHQAVMKQAREALEDMK